MDIDTTTCAATVWAGVLGATGIALHLSHPAGVAFALLTALPLALRLAMLAARGRRRGRITAVDAQALAWSQSAGDTHAGADGNRGPAQGRLAVDWRSAVL